MSRIVLVTGGSFQGKTKYARESYTDFVVFDDFEMMLQKYIDEYRADCDSQDDVEQYICHKIDELIACNKSCVFILKECGCGIVPMDKEERAFREICGRCGCYIAKRADEVVRLIMGIPQRIKG